MPLVSRQITSTGISAFTGWALRSESRVFDVQSYGAVPDATKAGGGTDSTTAFQAAINAAQTAGGGIVYAHGHYKITAQLSVTSSNVRLKGAGQGTTTIWHNYPTSSGFPFLIRIGGSFSPRVDNSSHLTTLSANAGPDQSSFGTSTTLNVTSASGIAVGDWLLVGDEYQEEMASTNGWTNRYRGEYCQVLSISGTTVTLVAQLRFPYTTARNAKVWKPALVRNVGISDMSIRAADGLQHTTYTGAIQLAATYGAQVTNVEIEGFDGSGVSLYATVETRIQHNFIHDLSNDGAEGGGSSRLGYNIAVGASEGTMISGNVLKNGRHGVTTGGANNLVGWCNGVSMIGNRCEGSDAAALDTHPATSDVVIANNTVDRAKDKGISCRSNRTTIQANTILRVGDSGIWVDRKASIDAVVIDNLVVEPAGYGIELTGNTNAAGTNNVIDGQPVRPLVMNNVVRNSWLAGIRFTVPIDNAQFIGNYLIDCGVSAPTATYAISFNVPDPGVTGLRFIDNYATGVSACVGCTGTSTPVSPALESIVTNSVFRGNTLANGVSTPAALKGSPITKSASNNILHGNGLESSTTFRQGVFQQPVGSSTSPFQVLDTAGVVRSSFGSAGNFSTNLNSFMAASMMFGGSSTDLGGGGTGILSWYPRSTAPTSAPTSAQALEWWNTDGTKWVWRKGQGAAEQVYSTSATAGTFVIADDAPLAAGTKFIMRMPFACTVNAVRVYRVGGTGATVNATQAGNDLLASALSASTASTILSTTTIQNATVAAGAAIVFRTDSVAGAVTQLRVEIDCVGT